MAKLCLTRTPQCARNCIDSFPPFSPGHSIFGAAFCASPARTFWLGCLLLACSLFSARLRAQTITIDGNPSDWPTVLSNTPTYVTTFIRDANNTNDNQFTNGSQDPDLISKWSWSNGNTNDKGDISNAGAALIGSNLYFFGDRTAVNGDAQIGFWFFKNNVGPIAGGSFSETHADGDILVLSNFTNGGGTVILHIYRWTGTGSGALQFVGTTTSAAVNSTDLTVPPYPMWTYTPKFGSGYVTGSFFEGVIDLKVLNLDPCFTSFLLETRNSQSITASLQDFVGARFDTKPSVTVNSPSRCSNGAGVTLTASVTGGLAPLSYSWSGPNGFTSQAPAITVTAAGIYTVIVSGKNGCQAEPASGTVIVYPAATTEVGGLIAACQSASPSAIALTGASVGGGASTGTWSVVSPAAGGGALSSTSPTATPGSVTFTPAANYAGSVVLQLTSDDPAGPCEAVSRQVTLTISPAASANAGPAQTVCASSPLVQLAGSVNGASGGTWSGGAGTFAPNATTLAATYLPTAAEISTGSVTLTLTTTGQTSPCTAAMASMTITINPVATVTAVTPGAVCQSASPSAIALTGASVGGGASTGTWSVISSTPAGGGGALSSTAPTATPGSVTFTPAANYAGSVVLQLTSNNPAGPCEAVSRQVTLTINPAATAQAGADRTVCASSPAVTLAGGVGGGITTGTWSSTGTGSFSPNTTALNATYTPSNADISAGAVTLTLASDDPAGPCGPASDQMTITINPAATVSAGPDQTVCAAGAAVTLAGQVGGGASSGTWSGGAGTFSPNAMTLTATYTPSAAEILAHTVTLTLTTNDPAGPCDAVAKQLVITISPAASANAGPAQTVCASSPLVQLAGSVNGASGGTWSGGAGTFAPNATTLAATYLPTAAEISTGSVTLTLTTTGQTSPCTAAMASMTITINARPDAPTLAVTQPSCTQSTGTLRVTSATDGLTFSLDAQLFGAYPSTGWAVSPGSHTVRAMSAASCVSESASATVNATPNCLVQHCTLTQGGYGNGQGIICKEPTKRRTQLIADMLTSMDVVLGLPGRSLTFYHSADPNSNLTTALCIIAKMPAGGTAAAFPVSLGDANGCSSTSSYPTGFLKNGRFNNVLVGQTLALTLNMRLDNTLAGVPLSASMTSYAALNCDGLDPLDLVGITKTISGAVLSNLGANATVSDLLLLANKALAGVQYTPYGSTPSASEISGAVAAINELFDNCRMYTSPTLVVARSLSANVQASGPALAAKTTTAYSEALHAFPNPFSANTTLEFTLPQTAGYELVVYDIKGRLVARVSTGEAQAGVRYTFPLGGSLQEGVYVARLLTESGTQTIRLNLIK